MTKFLNELIKYAKTKAIAFIAVLAILFVLSNIFIF